MRKKIHSALISVFHKDGLDTIVRLLHENGITIYSTGGTQQYLEQQKIPCIAVESITGYPSILGGRVKTLHPSVFGGILGKRDDKKHLAEMDEHHIPVIDLVIVDLYPFEETVRLTNDESLIIEKIDIGGPSMIRAAAKNFKDVVVVASNTEYTELAKILREEFCATTIEQRRNLASRAFDICSAYDNAISSYFSGKNFQTIFGSDETSLRYGENPHQPAFFYGNIERYLKKLHGKELSYNNLVDVDSALQLMNDLKEETESVFAIIKHTNVCGIALRNIQAEAWKSALAGDPESAFGGVLISNKVIDAETAALVNELFFEVLIAKGYDEDALAILMSKKNRILLIAEKYPDYKQQSRSVLGGVLMQDHDTVNFEKWEETGGRPSTEKEKADLKFANLICKHLKSNAIALVKDMQLVGKGCGQTSRIDALRQAINKASQFKISLNNAVLSSDAFFPFDDCVKVAHENGITAFIQPGGSIRDKDSIAYCVDNKLAMVLTGTRHFKH